MNPGFNPHNTLTFGLTTFGLRNETAVSIQRQALRDATANYRIYARSRRRIWQSAEGLPVGVCGSDAFLD